MLLNQQKLIRQMKDNKLPLITKNDGSAIGDISDSMGYSAVNKSEGNVSVDDAAMDLERTNEDSLLT